MDWKYLERVKWANDCQSCSIHINVNDHAYWKKDVGIRHTYCMDASGLLKFTDDELRRANLDLAASIQETKKENEQISALNHNLHSLAIINSNTLEELQENISNISTRSFDNYVQSKQYLVPITFPLCRKCGKNNDVPAIELCEQCEINNVISDVDRNKRGNARRIIRAFRQDPVIKYRREIPGVIGCLSISDGGDRYKAIENYGIKAGYTDKDAFLVLIDQLDGIFIDRSKRGNELFEVDMFQPKNAKILRYRDPSTDEIYACFVPTDIIKADEAMAWKFFLTEEQYDGMRVEA